MNTVLVILWQGKTGTLDYTGLLQRLKTLFVHVLYSVWTTGDTTQPYLPDGRKSKWGWFPDTNMSLSKRLTDNNNYFQAGSSSLLVLSHCA